ncbi:hypothetical protein RB195_002493 [Necator americanus]|uniref:Uncharacterized protein n=1 Tax=Necator americanus TaxID=51031 RepID=A0ABR1DKR3_NECAM
MHAMESTSLNSSFTWSDYSITEDEAYVYCRVGAASKTDTKETFWRANSPKPTFENWTKANRDSGFAEKMLVNEDTYTHFEEDSVEGDEKHGEDEVDDHNYYNLLPFQTGGKEDHDYTYPAFDREMPVNVKLLKGNTAPRRIRAKFRRNDSQLSGISARTVINAARPYRGIQKEPTTTTPIHLNTLSRRKGCCVECREEELEKLDTCPNAHKVTYENLHHMKELDTIELYGRLILTAMMELRSAPGGMKRTKALQRKIEKILRLQTEIDLGSPHEDFETTIKQFETLVERRLRAINDISPTCYQRIADKLCYTQSAARRQKPLFVRLGSIRKGILKMLGI